MTDSIDLDELDVEPEADEEPNRGDWFWSDGDDPADEASAATPDDAEPTADSDSDSDADASADTGTDTDSTADDDGDRPADASTAAPATALGADEPGPAAYEDDLGADLESATPRVPYADDDKPVGIPRATGGAGGVSSDARDEEAQEQPEATGPHGSGPAEMTMAISYRAIRRLKNLHAALADAEGWTDYVGIVGDVDAHVINKFQRDNRLDLDFFNGTGTGPAERLAEVGPTSMFYADRMALVGVEEAGERAWAEAADWEFVPLAEAAAGAEWELLDPEEADGAAGDDAAAPESDESLPESAADAGEDATDTDDAA